MAKLLIKIASDSTIIPINGVDLVGQTNVGLIDELIAAGHLPPPQSSSVQYHLAGKNGQILVDKVTLKEAGFGDGDEILLLTKGHGA